MIKLKKIFLEIIANFNIKQSSASIQDMQDSLDHIKDFSEEDVSLQDFSKQNKIMTIDEIGNYDDLSSWPEWRLNELKNLDESELYNELVSFRGNDWAKRAFQWIATGEWPAIVIVKLSNGYTQVGDGRGRVSLALGLGIPRLPVTLLTQR